MQQFKRLRHKSVVRDSVRRVMHYEQRPYFLSKSRQDYYTLSVLIRNGPIHTSEISRFFKEITSEILKPFAYPPDLEEVPFFSI